MIYRQGYNISARAILLGVFDGLAMGVVLYLAFITRFGVEAGELEFFDHLPTIGGTIIIFLLVAYIAGMYDPLVLAKMRATLAVTGATVSCGFMAVVLAFFAQFNLFIGRGVLVISAFYIFAALLFVRVVYRMGVGRGFFQRPTLVVGEAALSEQAIQLIHSDQREIIKVFGVISTEREFEEEFIGQTPVLGPLPALRDFINAYGVEILVLTTPLSEEPELLKTLRPLRYAGIQIMDLVSLREEIDQAIPLDHIDDEWLMHVAMNSRQIHTRQIKRIMDLLVSALGLVLLAPLGLLAALAIKLDSHGPVLYRQVRSGKDGVPYTLLKFRTMRSDAEAETGAVWAGEADARVTRVGKWFRLFRIDEIPQLWNVLRGQMSLVGPRPERPIFVDALTRTVPFFPERLMVKPGITGWAQVKYPYAASVQAARKKLEYDLYYVKHASVTLDILILLRTFKTILVGLRHSEGVAIPPDDEQLDAELKVVGSDRRSA